MNLARDARAQDGSAPVSRLADAVAGGAAGLLAGLAMKVLGGAIATLHGLGFFYPLQLVAATVWGPSALDRGIAGIVAGLCLHLALSVSWGVVYGLVLPSLVARDAGAAVGYGLMLGAIAFALTHYLVAPVVNPYLVRNAEPATLLVEYLLFGACLALTLPLRRVAARHHEPGHARPTVPLTPHYS